MPLALLLVYLVALLVVQWQMVRANFPYMNHIDEGHIVRHAQNMYKTETLDPHWYQYGAALMHSINLVVSLDSFLDGDEVRLKSLIGIYPHGSMPDEWKRFPTLPEYSLVEPPQFLLAGRLLILAFSVLSLLLLYLLALRWFSPWEALLPVIILGSIPDIFKYQTLVHGDIPVMACLLAVFIFSFVWLESKNHLYLVAAGLISGFAMGIKYSGLLLLGIPVLFVLSQLHLRQLRDWTKVGLKLLGLLLCLVCGYYLSNPGSLGNEAEIFETFLWDKQYYAKKGKRFSYWNSLITRENIGSELFALAIIGVGFALASIRSLCSNSYGRVTIIAALIASIWSLAYLVTFWRYDYQPIRNLFCIMPFFAILVSRGLLGLRDLFSRTDRTRVFGLVLIPLIVLTKFYDNSQVFFERTGQPDSRIQLTEWLLREIPQGSEIRFHRAVAMANGDLGRLGKAGFEVMTIANEEELLEGDRGTYIVIPAPRASYLAKTIFPDALERKQLSVRKRFGEFETDYYPNIFRDNHTKLVVYSGSLDSQ